MAVDIAIALAGKGVAAVRTFLGIMAQRRIQFGKY